MTMCTTSAMVDDDGDGEVYDCDDDGFDAPTKGCERVTLPSKLKKYRISSARHNERERAKQTIK